MRVDYSLSYKGAYRMRLVVDLTCGSLQYYIGGNPIDYCGGSCVTVGRSFVNESPWFVFAR